MVSPISAGGGFTRTGIATIVDMESLEIEVDVNESYIARVKPGQRVEAVLDAYPDWQIPSKVRTVIPTADRQKATVKVRISFDKLDPRILPDMGVKVAFLADEAAGGREADGCRGPSSRRRPCGTTTGRRSSSSCGKAGWSAAPWPSGGTRGRDVEIMAGVVAGERVVVGGPERLRDGQRVKVK